MASLTPSRLTLPAGGQTRPQVTVDVQPGAPGLYSGAVVATPAGGRAVRVPLGFYKEPERYDLTLTATGRDGRPAPLADAGVMNVDNGELFADFVTVSLVGDPEVEVTGATSFSLDARRAQPVASGIEGVATDPSFADLGYTRLDATDAFGLASSFSVGGEVAEGGLFAEPTGGPVSVGRFEVELRTRLLPGPARRPPPPSSTTCSSTAARSPTRPTGSCPRPSGTGQGGQRLPEPQRPGRLLRRPGRLRAPAVLRFGEL